MRSKKPKIKTILAYVKQYNEDVSSTLAILVLISMYCRQRQSKALLELFLILSKYELVRNVALSQHNTPIYLDGSF